MNTTQPYGQSSIPEDLPRALRRWNWGAFLLNWIWAIGNRCYFGLLIFVPLFGLIVPFVLGVKGNVWAWKAGNWRSLEEFQQTQRRWVRWALLAYAGASVMAVALFFVITAQMKRTAAFELAFAELSRSQQVAQLLGAPLEAGRVNGSIKVAGGSGEAALDFDLAGPQRKGRAYVQAIKQADQWSVQQLALVLEDGQRLDLREQAVHSVADIPAAAPLPPTAAEPPRLPAMRLHLTNEPIHVRGALAQEAIERALAAQRSTLEPCLEQAPGAAKLTLKLIIAPNGDLQRASVEHARGVDAQARECVVQAARGFELPAPDHGIAVVTQTIAIAP